MIICLERGADLRTAQLMPLPPHRAVPEKGPLNVCVCVRVVFDAVNSYKVLQEWLV